jgi:aryl-alcohol dehydrogenase-like predicted oxidoreductase
MTKTIARTVEPLLAIGLGGWETLDVPVGQPREGVWETLAVFFEHGGRVVDTNPTGTAEACTGARHNRGPVPGDQDSDPTVPLYRPLERSMERLWRDQVDLAQCRSGADPGRLARLLHRWKQEGRIRYPGFTLPDRSHSRRKEPFLRKGLFDFVQLPYAPAVRSAADRTLRVAADAVVAGLATSRSRKANCPG